MGTVQEQHTVLSITNTEGELPSGEHYEIGIYGFENQEDFKNKEEDDDSKLAVYDPWSRDRIEDAREDKDEDEDDDNYYRSLYRR